MATDTIRTILESRYQQPLVDSILSSYGLLKENFYLGKFKPSELEGGFFVEAIRRVIEFELFNVTVNVTTPLPNFTDQEIKRYEQASGDESFRIHIPRVLRAIYNIRNKRGVGHIAGVIPNVIDSTLIMSSCDWVLAELIRINSNLPFDACEELINNIVERKIPIVFEHFGVKRVLDTTKSAREQVLILLYHTGNAVSISELQKWIEYKNANRFKEIIIGELHSKRYIEFNGEKCVITPKGIIETESILSH